MHYPQINIKNEIYSNESAINTVPRYLLVTMLQVECVCVPPPCDHIRSWDIREIIRVRGDYERGFLMHRITVFMRLTRYLASSLLLTM
jgi:hypothetical protein